MATLGKRQRGEHDEVSPPPLRRKLLQEEKEGKEEMTQKTESADQNNLLRVYSWNVNGVGPFLQKPITSFFTPTKATTAYSLRNVFRKLQWPQIFCIQEVKINPKDEATKRALERAANGTGVSENIPAYSAIYSLPRDKFNAKGFGGKVYGVATFIRDDFLGQVKANKEVEWDLEGRVLITELEKKVVVVNGYWVNGTENPYRDPQSGEVVGTRHDRKRAFHQLMLKECLAYEAKGWIVVLVGDMNVARGPLDGFPGIRLGAAHVLNRGDFNKTFFTSETGFRGIDAFRYFHGDESKYTYRGRGHVWGASCDRVDLIIVSGAALDRPGLVVDADILDTPEDRGHSDHVPLYITIDLDKLGD